MTLVSCERGDIRQSPDGLLVYSERGREEIALPNDKSPRDRVIEEFADAIAGKPVTHTGRWGLANLEVCTAAIESSRTGKEIELKHQVAVARSKRSVHAADQAEAFVRRRACGDVGRRRQRRICPPPTSTG